MNLKNICHLRQLSRSLVTALAAFFFVLPSLASAQGYQISTGDDFGAVIDASGKLYLRGAIQSSPGGVTEVLPSGGWDAVEVSRSVAAEAHVLAIRDNGQLWALGKNDRGQVGNNTRADQVEPVRVGGGSDWGEVAVGSNFSLARRANNEVYVWGDNTSGS